MVFYIIVVVVLVVWYLSFVKLKFVMVVVYLFMKLVMVMNEKYSFVVVEFLVEGMDSIWKVCISFEIFRLIGDIFF